MSVLAQMRAWELEIVQTLKTLLTVYAIWGSLVAVEDLVQVRNDLNYIILIFIFSDCCISLYGTLYGILNCRS